jgi:Protein of unknown function (DUF2924)
MALNVNKALAELQRMDVRALKRRYAEVFKEPARNGNKPFLVKRIIWRLQANEEGSLSERALQRARELANEADLRLTPPRHKAPVGESVTVVVKPAAGALAPGTMLTRQYQGRTLQVGVVENGFEFEGDRYRSLSAIARKVTGTQWNGHLFFGLRKAGKP